MNQTHSQRLHSGCVQALHVPVAQQLDNMATKSTAVAAVNGKRGHC